MDATRSDERLRYAEAACDVAAPAEAVFQYIDQPERLSAHMARRSWQMAGSTMVIETDTAGGRSVGSHIRLLGHMLGIALSAECVVLRRDPPTLKEWETIGEPRLIVIGGYRMEVAIEARGDNSTVTISIEYALPRQALQRRIGQLLGAPYARWCVQQMARDLVHQFGPYKT